MTCGVRRPVALVRKALEQTAGPWSAPVTRSVVKVLSKTQYLNEDPACMTVNRTGRMRLTLVSHATSMSILSVVRRKMLTDFGPVLYTTMRRLCG